MKTPVLRTLASACLLAASAAPIHAHNLDTVATSISFSNDFVATMSQRAAANQPLVNVGDEFWVLLKTTPGPGTDTGVGGYQTFYAPDGVEVIDAAYVFPDPSDPRGFRNIPMKGQSPIAVGNGSIGPATSPELVGFVLPGENGLGFKTAPVTATGAHRGTLAGVYADTGIFYSTDPRTSFNSYGTPLPPDAGSPMKNNSGDTVGEYFASNITNSATRKVLGVMTLWDSQQLRAYGRADVSPLLDGNGRGNAPWGLANVVPGPQSGYAWEFDHAAYESTPGTNAQKIQAALKVGPWNRIKYPGSQISQDQPGLISNTLGQAGTDASFMGIDPTEIPSDATAIRFAIGQLELGRPEFSAVKVRINAAPGSGDCQIMNADAFGGDAGGTEGGKDHIWRYFDPTVVSLNPCTFLQKVASKALVAPGETFYYDITFANNGTMDLPNFTITDVLPNGITHVSATPAQNTISGQTLTWNFGTVQPGDFITIRHYVKATGSGTLFNTATARSGINVVGVAQASVEVGNRAILEKHKTVTPSAVAPGETVTYTLNIDNLGTGNNGVPMTVREYLPPGFTFVSLQGATLNGATISSPTITTNSTNPALPVFTVNQGIQPGKKLVIRFNALVGANVQPGTYWNSFQLEYEGKIVPPIPEAPVIVAGGKIGDTVWRDWNGNGVQDAGEPGFPGVSVELYAADGTTLLRTTTTDSNGNYYFPGLVAGTYVVKVVQPANTTQTGDPDETVDNQHTVNLATDEQYMAADFGFRPSGLGTIGDLVFEDAGNDRVFTPGTDAVISGVGVDLYADINGDGAVTPGVDVLIGSTTTNGGGLYSFTGLAEGFNYVVSVNPADTALAAYFGVDPFQASTPNPHAVTNLTGSYLAADFGFWRVAPASIGDQVFMDVDGNGLYNPAVDRPLSNVTVELFREGELVGTAISGPDGGYLFDGLGPGSYVVEVDASSAGVTNGLRPMVSQYSVSLVPGQAFLTADFPFRSLLTKTAAPGTAVPGTDITYTLRPYYPGGDLLENFRVIDPLPAGTTYKAGTANAGGTFGPYTALAAVPGSDLSDSGATLTTSLTRSASFVTTGGSLTVTLNVHSTQAIANVSPTLLEVSGGAFTILSGPTPATQNVPAGGGGVNYTWTVRLDAPGEYVFSAAAADAAETTTWAEATSASVLSATSGGTNVVTWNLGSNQARVSGETVISGRPPQFFAFRGANKKEFSRYGLTSQGWTAKAQPTNGIEKGGSLTTAGDGRFWALEGNSKWFYRYDAAPNTWTRRADTSDNANEGGAVQFLNVGGTEYVFALLGNSNRFRRFNVATNLWTDLPNTPENVKKGGALTTDGTYLYALRGDTKKDFWRYDPVAATWSPLALAPQNVGWGGSLTRIGGFIYALRGDGKPDFWRYNIATDSWSVMAPAPANASDGGALSTDGTHIYALQGRTKNFWRYNVALNSWTVLSPTNFEGNVGQGGALVYDPGMVGDTLTSQVTASPILATHGDTLTFRAEFQATAAISGVTAGTPSLTNTNGATLTPVSGPTLVSADNNLTSPEDSVIYQWTYTASSGSNPGTVRMTVNATGSDPTTFPNAISRTVIVSPVLSFKATVNAGAPAIVNNTGLASDSTGSFDAIRSNTTNTPTSGSIGDFVYADLDGDGTQDAGEYGISGVSVKLFAADGVTLLASTVTDSSGLYLFSGLAAGSYVVSIDASTAPSGFFPTTPVSLPVALSTAQQYVTADFGLNQLPPGTGSIGDYVWIDANNDGVQDAGELPLSNVTVILERLINGSWITVASDVTDSDGAYGFTGLSAAQYRVTVDTSSQITSPYAQGTFALGDVMAPTSDRDGTGTPHVALVTLATDTTVIDNADFGYNWSGSIGDFVWWDHNTNGLQDESPLDGVENARVQLYFDQDFDGVFDRILGDFEILRVFTDANGSYLIPNLPPGNYFVDVYEDSITTDGVRDIVSTTDDIVPVNLSPGNMSVDTADFGYYEGARVEATVFWDANHNGIRDGGEPLLANVTVTLTGTNSFGDPITQTAQTDSNGHVTFLVPGGDYTISYDTADITANYPALGTATTPLSFEFTAVPGDDGIRRFYFGVDNTGAIGDTIFADIDGNGSQSGSEPGLADVTVNLYLDLDGNGVIDFGAGDLLLETSVTDANGKYSFGGLEDTSGASRYLVEVVTSTLPQAYETEPTAYPAGADFANSRYSTELTNGEAIDIVDFGYPPVPDVYYTVSGTIYHDNGDGGGISSDGQPNGTEPGLAGVSVRIEVDADGNGSYEQIYVIPTDANGFYSLGGIPENADVRVTVINGTLPSNAFVQTGDPDGAPLSNVWTIADIQQDEVEIDFGYLENLGSIAGTVVKGNGNGSADPGEEPREGVTVTATYSGPDGLPGNADDEVFTTTTDANGDYSFTGLLPGSYVITTGIPAGFHEYADADGFNPNSINLTLPVGADVTDRDFEYQSGSISGYVWTDANADAIRGVSEPVLENITVFLDLDGNGALDPGEPFTSTDSSGYYGFTGLDSGSHNVRVDPTGLPSGSFASYDVDGIGTPNLGVVTLAPNEDRTEVDFGYYQHGSIAGSVLTDTSGDPIPGVTVSLLDASGNPVLDGMGAPITTVTDEEGAYSFGGLRPGDYQVLETQPEGYYSVSDRDGGNKDLIGDVTLVTVVSGEANSGNDFIEEIGTCIPTWAAWKQLHPGEEADGNPEADMHDNLNEFAFAMDPYSGAGDAYRIQPSEITSGKIDAVFIRPVGAVDNVTYTLQYAATVGNPTVWSSIVIDPSMYVSEPFGTCLEKITITDLETLTGLTGGTGVVRIRTDLDEENDTTVDHTSYTGAEGWKRTPFGICCQTYNTPYLTDTVFTGVVSAGGISGQTVDLSGSSVATDLAALLSAPGATYFLEITEGEGEGNRYDIVSAAGSAVTLADDASLSAAGAPYNTVTGAPYGFEGSSIVIRRHRTLAELFPPSEFVSSTDQALADEVQIYSGGAWTILHLFDDSGTPRWVDNFNSLIDQGGLIIAPGQGLFLNNRNSPKNLLAYGEVRENDFIRPLAAGSNLVGGGYPLSQSATGTGSRVMTTGHGFFGSKDFKTADSFFVWTGDTTPGRGSYDTYYLLNGAPQSPSLLRWVMVGDATALARNSEILLLENRAVFTRSAFGVPAYRYPAPWLADPPAP